MNKIEYQQRLDEVLQMISNGRYQEAVDLCDTISLDQLRSPKNLQKIAKAYEKCRRYADAEDILLQAREAAPRSRSTLFHLCTVAVKADDLESARAYYEAFANVAPDDKERYVLQYRIAMKEGVPANQLIRILEASKEFEPDDKWMLELARLYAGVGDNEKSLETCNEIEMWFSSGKYVEAAQELRRRIEAGDSFEGVLPKTKGNSVTEDETMELDIPQEDTSYSLETAEVPSGEEAPAEEAPEEEVPVRPAEPVRRGSRGEARPRRGFAFFGKNNQEKAEKAEKAEKQEKPERIESRYEQPVGPGGSPEEYRRASREKRRQMELTGDSWIPAWTGTIPDIEGDPDLSDAGISPYSTASFEKPAVKRPGKNDSWAFTMDVGSATPERTGRIETITDEDEARYYAYSDAASRKAQMPEEDSRYAKSGIYEAQEPPKKPEEKPKKKDYDDYTAALGVIPDKVYDKDLEEELRKPRKEEEKAPERIEEDPVKQAIEAPDEHVTIKVKGPSVQKAVEYETVSFDTLKTPTVTESGVKAAAEEPEETQEEKSPAEEAPQAEEKKTAWEEPDKNRQDSGELYFTRPSQEPLPADYGLSAEEIDARVTEQDLKDRKLADLEQFKTLPIEPEIDKSIWHFLVIGDNPALTLECARERMKELGEMYPNGPKKMLKIAAEKIGDASIVNSLDRFLGNMVIVQHVSVLQDRQLKEFAKILDKDDRSLLVAFTDRRSAVADVLKRAPELFNSFTAVFEGRTYTPRDLVDVAKEYLLKEDAKLSRDAQAVVFEEARRILQENTGYYRNKIRAFVKEALDRADNGGFLGLGGGRFDKNGYLVVSARHFK